MSKNIEEFAWLRDRLLPLETFNSALRRGRPVRNFFKARRRLLQRIATDNVGTVVTLMPHIWTPLLARSIRARGTEYVTIMHNSVSHPGDPTASVLPWLRSEARLADHVVTLSRAVADHMIGHGFADRKKTHALFLPDLRYDSVFGAKSWSANEPLRLLLHGPHPPLQRAVAAARRDRDAARRWPAGVRLGVAGAGDIDVERERLTALGAEGSSSRWLEDKEIAPLLARYDAMALPYIEASSVRRRRRRVWQLHAGDRDAIGRACRAGDRGKNRRACTEREREVVRRWHSPACNQPVVVCADLAIVGARRPGSFDADVHRAHVATGRRN